jgi:two-component system, chemotaxis family, protein-glutamate methylesterase/glutaminase
MKPLRLLVVDDSRTSRDHIRSIVDGLDTVEVVATATNGADALRAVRERQVEVVTLDLEMPHMDGFSFLKVLMGTFPLPVIVVSSDSRRDIVLKALELGALDFVAKSAGDSKGFATMLTQKLRLIRSAKVVRPSMPVLRALRAPAKTESVAPQSTNYRAPRYLVGIAASTGGPAALMELVSKLSGFDQFAFVIAQHMPARFTTSFAERLNRIGTLPVMEAQDGDSVSARRILLCPGDHCMTVERQPDGRMFTRLHPPLPEERYVPNATRLLISVAAAVKNRAVGIVLTGMGDDGSEGAKAIEVAGGRVYVEAFSRAVIPSMPEAAARAAQSAVQCTLEQIPRRLQGLVETKA